MAIKKKKVDRVVTRRRKLATSFGLSSSRQTGRVAHLLSTTTLWEGLPSTHVVEGAGAPTSPIMRGRGWPTHVTDRRSKRTMSDRRTARASSRVLLNLANGERRNYRQTLLRFRGTQTEQHTPQWFTLTPAITWSGHYVKGAPPPFAPPPPHPFPDAIFTSALARFWIQHLH